MHTTSPSLLEQLRQPTNQAAWRRFVQLYTPLLHHWARRLGLQDHDAENLVQEVLLTLLDVLPRFNYQPGKRFRGWLWTVTLNKHRRQPTPPLLLAGDGQLEGCEANGHAEEIEEAEYRQYLVDRALRLMQS